MIHVQLYYDKFLNHFTLNKGDILTVILFRNFFPLDYFLFILFDYKIN